ncbi:hypothetical protein Pint_12057 [Pistacia integerrima]|uniref:Uncharacterized protein n=1 Tax=Pistacia integerrima TaxID=434235 RepID=A0ACC0XFB0_9ROSI|nr:hypothetical protein Pint_12057 [Pistacia integerrima]
MATSSPESFQSDMEQCVIIQLANPSQPVASSTQHMALSSSQLDDLKKYLPFYKAILGGDLLYVQEVCGTNKDGKSVLSVAAIVGNVQAAKKIRKKWPDLLDIQTLLIEAARPTTNYRLISSTYIYICPSSYVSDLAVREVEDYPNLALMELDHGETLLSTMAKKRIAFSIGKKLNFCQNTVYICQREYFCNGTPHIMQIHPKLHDQKHDAVHPKLQSKHDAVHPKLQSKNDAMHLEQQPKNDVMHPNLHPKHLLEVCPWHYIK